MREVKAEFIQARITPSEKLMLYGLARKHGGLSAALRYLIQQYQVSTKAKSTDTFQGEGALRSN